MDEFNPYGAAESAVVPEGSSALDQAGCWRHGNLLVMARGALLPDRCLKCNFPTNWYYLPRKLSWHHPAWFLLAVAPFLYFAVVLFVQQEAEIKVGLCPFHRELRSRAIRLAWILSLTGVALISVGQDSRGNAFGVLALLFGFLLLLTGLIHGFLKGRVTYVKKIDKRFVWLRKVHPAYLSDLPTWGGGITRFPPSTPPRRSA